MTSAAPDWPDCVDDEPCRKVVPAGDPRCAGRTADAGADLPNPLALLEEPWAGRPVNRAVDTPAAEKTFVRRVDDRVHLEPRDVAPHSLDPFHGPGWQLGQT